VVSRSDFVRCLSLDRSLAGLIAEGLEQDEFAPAEVAPKPARSVSAAELAGRSVRDVMVTEPLTVTPDTPITEVAALLVGQHRHRIIVTEGGSVRGIISTMDLVRLIADGQVREP
jgi:CBS domain-containing protein